MGLPFSSLFKDNKPNFCSYYAYTVRCDPFLAHDLTEENHCFFTQCPHSINSQMKQTQNIGEKRLLLVSIKRVKLSNNFHYNHFPV